MLFNGSDGRSTRNKISANRKSIKIETKNFHEPSYLKLYDTPPGDDISLSEFDEIAMERLKLLKNFENCKDSCKFNSQEFNNKFRPLWMKTKLIVLPKEMMSFDKTAQDVSDCWRRDTIGHFILRLAFCRTPENTKWLVQQESDLFRYRFMNEKMEVIDKAFQNMNLDIYKLSAEDVQEMEDDLINACQISHADLKTGTIYRVAFTDAAELFRRGGVHLKKGYAYFPYDGLVTIVVSKFKSIMTSAMARAYKHLAILEEEGRLLPRLSRLANNVYDGKEYSGDNNTDQITRHMIDKLAVKSFPPCMKSIHSNLRVNHHLKYGARNQYGLFLKALGLSLDEAMAMMRDEFTKKVASDKFDKEYAYNIRYMYGKEGRRVAQNALSCARIILHHPPSALDCHGCPFRHIEKPILAQRLQKENMNKEQIEKIITLSESNMYDKACTRFFEFSHKMEEGALGSLITHPNQYYEESQKIIGDIKAAKLGSQPIKTDSQS